MSVRHGADSVAGGEIALLGLGNAGLTRRLGYYRNEHMSHLKSIKSKAGKDTLSVRVAIWLCSI